MSEDKKIKTSNEENEEITALATYPDDIEDGTMIIGLPRLHKVLNELEPQEEEVELLPISHLKNSPFSNYYYSNFALSEPVNKLYLESLKVQDRINGYTHDETIDELAIPIEEQENIFYDYKNHLILLPGQEPIKVEVAQEKVEVKPERKHRRKRSELILPSSKKEEETVVVEKTKVVPSKEIRKEEKKSGGPLSRLFKQRQRESKRQLKRQEKIRQEKVKSQTQQLTQNLGIPTNAETELIFSKVPENLLNGGITLFNNLTKQMQHDGTLRVEFLMAVLGALAGYSTQAAAREKMINRLRLSEDQVFSIIETADGNKYYFGDAIDRTLQKDKHSIWYMAATAAMKLTGNVNVNINEVVNHSIRHLGQKTFGVPRIPKKLRADHLPEYYVENVWPAIEPGLKRFSKDPMDWPIIMGVALQRAMIATKDILDPNTSLRIILECAVPMSIMDIDVNYPGQMLSEQEKKRKVEKTREEIEVLRNTLNSRNLPQEQRAFLIQELSEKTELLYELLS